MKQLRLCLMILLCLLTRLSLSQEIRDSIKQEQTDTTEENLTNIYFVGSGDLQKDFGSDDGFGAGTGLGMVFERQWAKDHFFQDLELDIYINIASNADTLRIGNALQGRNNRTLGAYLLLPNQTKQATSFSIFAHFGHPKKKHWTHWINGVQCSFNASNTILKESETSVHLTGLALRTGIFHDFMPDDLRREKGFSLMLGANYAFRGLLGDLASPEYDHWRKKTFKTTRTHFHGLEFNLELRLKNIRAGVQLPIFPGRKDNIPGLTNAQFITTLTFVGGFPLKLTD